MSGGKKGKNMNDYKLEYNVNHDLEWLKSVISLATPDNPILDFDKGYTRALKWVIELITDGMEKPE